MSEVRSNVVNNENVVNLGKVKAPVTTTRSARRNGLYLTNKELNDFNVERNKFGAQLSLNDIVTNSNTVEPANNFTIHEDRSTIKRFNSEIFLEEEDENDLKSTTSQNSDSTINKRSSIPYVSNRLSSSSYNGSSVRNSKRFSTMSGFSSDSDDDMKLEEDVAFNNCFFNNPHGRSRNLTTLSIHSKSSNESLGFKNPTGGKPGLVGFESEPKKPVKAHSKPAAVQQHSQKKPNIYRHSQISLTSDRRHSQISSTSDKRHSQISSTSSDRSSRRLSVLSLLRHQDQGTKHQPQLRPAEITPYAVSKQQSHISNKPQQAQPQSNSQSHQPQAQTSQNKPQVISQPSSSRIHRLMHSVSIRSGLFKLKEPTNLPQDEKKVQMKRSLFSIRSGLNRSTSTMEFATYGSNIDRTSISLPVPQDQTVQKIDHRLKNESSRYSLAPSEW